MTLEDWAIKRGLSAREIELLSALKKGPRFGYENFLIRRDTFSEDVETWLSAHLTSMKKPVEQRVSVIDRLLEDNAEAAEIQRKWVSFLGYCRICDINPTKGIIPAE